MAPNHALQQLVNRYRQPEQVDQRSHKTFNRDMRAIEDFRAQVRAHIRQQAARHSNLDMAVGYLSRRVR